MFPRSLSLVAGIGVRCIATGVQLMGCETCPWLSLLQAAGLGTGSCPTRANALGLRDASHQDLMRVVELQTLNWRSSASMGRRHVRHLSDSPAIALGTQSFCI